MNKPKLPIVFAIAAFLLGNGFVFVNPPLKAPDESAHFARAWLVSRFQWLPQQQHGLVGGRVPDGIDALGRRYGKVSFDGVSVTQILDGRRIPFDSRSLEFVFLPNIAEYSPLPYIPQAIGIATAQLFFRSALAIMYCGRETNLICYILLAYMALKAMPHPNARLTLALIALLPMSLYQAASLSPDGVTFAMSLGVATAVWRLACLEGPVPKFDLFMLFVSTICLSFTKMAYFPISLLVLMIPKKRLGDSRKYALIVGAILLCNGLTVLLWMSQFHGFPQIDLNPAMNPAAQEQFILHHPGKIFPVLIATTKTHGKEIATSVIGTFGWNEIMLPTILVVIYYALLLTSVGANGPPRYGRGAIVAFSTMIVEFSGIMAAFYIECRPVGEIALDGFQGRYLIPVLPLLIFFSGNKNITGKRFNRLLFIVAVLITAFSVLFLAQELYPGCPYSRFDYRWSD